MTDQKIFQMFGELERKTIMGNMALNKFAHESSNHFNTLVISFNAVKNLLVEKGIMTNEEIDERITLEVEKATAAQQNDEIMEEPSTEIIEDPDENEETPVEEDYEEEQEEG
jgi:hypothetical protein